jgi:hypothetical protein
MPRSQLNPDVDPGAAPPRWSRRWHFLAILAAAGIGWLIPAALVYLVFWRG